MTDRRAHSSGHERQLRMLHISFTTQYTHWLFLLVYSYCMLSIDNEDRLEVKLNRDCELESISLHIWMEARLETPTMSLRSALREWTTWGRIFLGYVRRLLVVSTMVSSSRLSKSTASSSAECLRWRKETGTAVNQTKHSVSVNIALIRRLRTH